MSIRKRNRALSAVFETLHPRTLMSADPGWGYAYASTDYSIGPSPITLYARATNPAAAGATVRFILSSDNQVGNADDILLASAPASSDVHVDTTLPDLPAGAYYLFATCDDAYPIAAGDLTVYSNPDGADLTIAPDNVYTGLPSAFSAGEFHNVSVAVINAGKTAAQNVSIALYLSPTPTLGPGAYLIQKRVVFGTDNVAGTIGARGTAYTAFMSDFPGPIPTGTYYPIAVVDPDNLVAEADESNNAFVGDPVRIIPPSADITLVSISTEPTVTIDPSKTIEPYRGTPQIPMDVTLRSNGSPQNLRLALYLSTDDIAGNADDMLVGYTGYFDTPAPGSTVTVHTTASYSFDRAYGTLGPGTYRLVAKTDNRPDVTPADNIVVGPEITLSEPTTPTYPQPPVWWPGTPPTEEPQLPDFTPGEVEIQVPDHVYAGTAFRGHVDLVTDAPAGSGTTILPVRYVLSRDNIAGNSDDIVIGTRQQWSIAAGETAAGAIFSNLRIPANIAPGRYHLVAIVDPYDNAVETNESNNTIVGGTITVEAGGEDAGTELPDLAASLSTSGASAGGTGRAALTLKNKSRSAVSQQYNVTFYLSSDPTLSAGDRAISRQTFTAKLGAGKSATAKLGFTLPKAAKVGDQYLIAVATPAAPAGDKSANAAALSAARGARIQAAAKITVAGPRLTAAVRSTKAVPGHPELARVTVRVTNTGTAAFAGAATVSVLSDGASPETLLTAARQLSVKAGKHTDITLTVRTPTTGTLRAVIS